MEHQDLNGTEQTRQSRRRTGRRNLFVFIFCVLLSALMWIFIELMKEYTTDISYPIGFTSVPSHLMLVNQADTTITVGLTAQGFELLEALYFKKKSSLEIDLSELRIRQDNEGYAAFMPAANLLRQVNRQLGSSKPVTYLKPDTLFFRFSEVAQKRVPVMLNIMLDFENQYQLYDSITFSPQAILVSSIRNVIDTITRVYTVYRKISAVDSSFSLSVPLKKTLSSSILRFSQDSVTVNIPVARYTEAVFDVPVAIDKPGNIKVFPEKVQVTCLVPMKSFREYSADDFKLIVNTEQSNLQVDRKLKAEVKESPRHVKITRIEPAELEYIILSK